MNYPLARCPSWWFSDLPHATHRDLIMLLTHCEKHDISPNDRTKVERLWLDVRAARIRARLAEVARNRETADE